jgi:hypothetical protein
VEFVFLITAFTNQLERTKGKKRKIEKKKKKKESKKKTPY